MRIIIIIIIMRAQMLLLLMRISGSYRMWGGCAT